MNPFIGEVVAYVISEDGPVEGSIAATIIAVHLGKVVDLAFFDMTETSVPYSEIKIPGTWHYPVTL